MQISVFRLRNQTRVARVRLEEIRILSRAIVDVFGTRAISCRIPFASPVITRHNQPQYLIWRSILRRFGHLRLTWSQEGAEGGRDGSYVWLLFGCELVEADWRKRLNRGIGLGWCGNLKRCAGWNGLLGHRVDGLARAPVQNVVLSRLAAMANRLVLLAVLFEREQHRGLRAVIIPNVMVHFLEMPHRNAREQVDSNDR